MELSILFSKVIILILINITVYIIGGLILLGLIISFINHMYDIDDYNED